MKNICWLFLILLVFNGCKKIKEAAVVKFDLKNEAKFTIPQITYVPGVTEGVKTALPSVSTNSQSVFNQYETSAANIEDARLTGLKLSIDQHSSQNFNFLKSISVYITAAGLGEKKIAYLDNVPENVASIDLIPTGEKLDEYIKKESYNLTIDVAVDGSTTEPINATANMIFHVRARLIK